MLDVVCPEALVNTTLYEEKFCKAIVVMLLVNVGVAEPVNEPVAPLNEAMSVQTEEPDGWYCQS